MKSIPLYMQLSVGSDGRVTLPKKFREDYGLLPSSIFLIKFKVKRILKKRNLIGIQGKLKDENSTK